MSWGTINSENRLDIGNGRDISVLDKDVDIKEIIIRCNINPILICHVKSKRPQIIKLLQKSSGLYYFDSRDTNLSYFFLELIANYGKCVKSLVMDINYFNREWFELIVQKNKRTLKHVEIFNPGIRRFKNKNLFSNCLQLEYIRIGLEFTDDSKIIHEINQKRTKMFRSIYYFLWIRPGNIDKNVWKRVAILAIQNW